MPLRSRYSLATPSAFKFDLRSSLFSLISSTSNATRPSECEHSWLSMLTRFGIAHASMTLRSLNRKVIKLSCCLIVNETYIRGSDDLAPNLTFVFLLRASAMLKQAWHCTRLGVGSPQEPLAIYKKLINSLFPSRS